MSRSAPPKPRPPLDRAGLEQLALRYVGRYATTRFKLAAYLTRKLRERGWDGAGEPPTDEIVSAMADLRYIDDAAFADSKARSLSARGYGPRRLAGALYAAGIGEEDGTAARAIARRCAWRAAEIFARKRRIGPFAGQRLLAERREKAIAAMVRAGHDFDIARRFVDSAPGEMPEAPD